MATCHAARAQPFQVPGGAVRSEPSELISADMRPPGGDSSGGSGALLSRRGPRPRAGWGWSVGSAVAREGVVDEGRDAGRGGGGWRRVAGGGGYRPFLDGLRAVAVYLVVVFHAGAGGFVGGFVGVDVFFVLSGFLVTRLLVRDLVGSGRVGLGRFYARRFRRLLPAAFVVLVVSAVVFSALASPVEVAEAEGGFRAAFLYVTNWYFIAQSADYFGADLATSPGVALLVVGGGGAVLPGVAAAAGGPVGARRAGSGRTGCGRSRSWSRPGRSCRWGGRWCCATRTRSGPTTGPTPGPTSSWPGPSWP